MKRKISGEENDVRIAHKKWSGEDILKIIGVIGTFVTLLLSFFEYRNAQQWKRGEFIAAKFKEFREDSFVKIASHILEYNQGYFVVSKDTFFFNDNLIYQSLRNDPLHSSYPPNQDIIRTVFDEYFDELSLFNRYIKSGLMKFEEIRPYFENQVKIVVDSANTQKPCEVRSKIAEYILYWRFQDVVELYGRYGYSVNASCDLEDRKKQK